MNELFYLILLPIIAGIFFWLIPERLRIIKGVLTLLICSVVFYFAVKIFNLNSSKISIRLPALLGLESAQEFFNIFVDPLCKTIILFIALFGVLYAIYSIAYTSKFYVRHYFSNYLFTVAISISVVLVDNLFTFIALWGILGYTLYKLMSQSDEESSAAAKKSFILIGASDSIMIFGIGLIWIISKSLVISQIKIETDSPLSVIAFVSIFIGAITKAGAFPMHTWVPDYTETSPSSSSALVPASLDKLLGIYLLSRATLNIFVLNRWLMLTLLIIGGITTVVAVMMALVQHNYKRLLGFHAVSQVGYMVTGFGIGSPAGIAGALFHMFNNALYKGGLFLVAGSVEKQTGKRDFSDVGGLSRLMPVTFVSALVFALSISGVPPFNGFASKWIIYQSIIEFGKGNGPGQIVWPIWLILAVFGSSLTLASFIKYVSGIFLGKTGDALKGVREVGFLMWLPQVIVALICLGFGIFATNFVVPKLIKPISGDFSYTGIWRSNTVTLLIIVSIVLGIIIYLLGKIKTRSADAFIGGETACDELDYSVTDFYKTVRELGILSSFYKWAEKKKFDIYDNTKGLVLGLNKFFSVCHNGLLQLYALWVIIGMIALMVILML